MSRLSSHLSIGDHRFVASIATYDLRQLITEKYAEISEKTNALHQAMAEDIVRLVDDRSEAQPEEILQKIANRAKKVKDEQQVRLRPFTTLSATVEALFASKGIELGAAEPLGNANKAISADWLSAGEKQMLSFLCYNAFATSSVIFIDEPEISLHVDWQRILVRILLDQSAGNQFIFSTHSPFIYANYEDREVAVSSVRGF